MVHDLRCSQNEDKRVKVKAGPHKGVRDWNEPSCMWRTTIERFCRQLAVTIKVEMIMR